MEKSGKTPLVEFLQRSTWPSYLVIGIDCPAWGLGNLPWWLCGATSGTFWQGHTCPCSSFRFAGDFRVNWRFNRPSLELCCHPRNPRNHFHVMFGGLEAARSDQQALEGRESNTLITHLWSGLECHTFGPPTALHFLFIQNAALPSHHRTKAAKVGGSALLILARQGVAVTNFPSTCLPVELLTEIPLDSHSANHGEVNAELVSSPPWPCLEPSYFLVHLLCPAFSWSTSILFSEKLTFLGISSSGSRNGCCGPQLHVWRWS